jgi:hypothetical protein
MEVSPDSLHGEVNDLSVAESVDESVTPEQTVYTCLGTTGKSPHIHWVERGTGTPKDRHEVKRREVGECDG